MKSKYQAIAADVEPAKTTTPSKKKSSHSVRRVVIEPADGGYIVTCEYESGDGKYPEPEKKVASSIDQLYTILGKKL
jgi:hypothetical protein